MKSLALSIYNHVYSRVFWVITSLVIILFCILSVIQVGFMTKDIYSIRDYQNRIAELSYDNQLLEVSFSQSNSLSNFDGLATNLKLEKTDRVQYIHVLDGQVVAR